MPKRSTDTILLDLKGLVESKKPIDRREWLDAAFYLAVLRIDEAKMLNEMKRSVAAEKLAILKAQDKRNVGAAEVEVEATEKFQFMKDQEDKLYSIDELIRVAKSSANEF